MISMSWQPKLRPKGFPHSIDDFAAMASLSELEHRARTEDKRDQRVFRVKRKHVLKACDRCRVKKTKVVPQTPTGSESTNPPQCDGKQPCNRCSVYNHPCLFRERKATQTKVYSRGFVEMLESHHSLVVKALQKLYKFCINNESFPGDPLAEAPDGHPLTHAILDRLGLIKQAEENADEPDEDSEDLRYLRLLSTSTECSVTAEPSPEPSTPPEPYPVSRPMAPAPLTRSNTAPNWQWDLPAQNYNYQDGYDLMPMPRSLTAPDIADIPPHADLASSALHEQSYPYALGCCDQPQDVKPVVSRMPLIDHQGHMGLSSEMMADFQFQGPEAFYPGFTPGWNFPSS
ncbi:C6 transcription factor [Penicillium brevicompactum]|uniref:C6 transcription factor n=1 Tax=Penicillium brevicompactum TaxID=5074 RepID=A0A9W9V0K4_PENBR|nr:C6 transcription factor [Penicillium brevicompactum]